MSSKKSYKSRKMKKGVCFMIATENVQRYCSVRESLIESCKQVKLMREGKMEKPTLQGLRNNIERYIREAKEEDEL
jgi:hypothetical protein